MHLSLLEISYIYSHTHTYVQQLFILDKEMYLINYSAYSVVRKEKEFFILCKLSDASFVFKSVQIENNF